MLQASISTQQIQIEQHQRDLAFETRDREYDMRDIRWKWGIASTVVAAIFSILSWFGMKSSKDLQDVWKRKAQQMMDDATFKLDPSNLPIYLPSGEGLEGLHDTLQKRRFGKVSFYGNLIDEFNKGNCQGVIVISLKDKKEKEQEKILSDFQSFIEQQLPDSSKTGFIIFAPGDIRVPPKVTGSYDNLVTANFPATVVSMVFAVGRGLDIVPNNKT